MLHFKKGFVISSILLSTTTLPLTANAASVDELTQRIEQLESKQSFSPAFKISGVIEVEYGVTDTDNTTESDITLATVELGIDAELSDKVKAHLLFLHEDDETEPIEVDEAILTIAEGGFIFSAGRMYLPFGNFETNAISDPLTLELAETKEAAIQFAYGIGGLNTSVYLFNGDSANSGDDKAEIYGVNLTYTVEQDNFSYDLGLDFISSIADSNGLTDGLDNLGTDITALNDYVAGAAVHANFWLGANNLFVEYVQAVDTFADGELDFKGKGAQPAALNIEYGYALELSEKEIQFALAYQVTDESVALELPKTRIILAASFDVVENVGLGIEIATAKDYKVKDGGSDEDTTTLTIQLAAGF